LQNPSDYKENLFYGASPEIVKMARELRNNLTEAENILWQEIRNRKLDGYKFRRQHPIDKFIVDFYCHKKKLVVELDGGIHNHEEIKEYDVARSDELEMFDIKVIRFTNEEVYKNLDDVLRRIKQELQYLKP
jgi:very-short-patch-repair endonuclease